MPNEGQSPTATKFCRYFSFIYSIVIFCLIIVKIIFTFKTKMRTTIFSLHIIHLIIGIILNVVSYLIEFISENTGNIPCKASAICHISSLNLLINMLFIFYLISLLSIKTSRYAKKISFHIGIYVINWIIIGLFICFYLLDQPKKNILEICRYRIDFTDKIQIADLNTIYSFVMLIAICICFFRLNCKLKKFNGSSISQNSSKQVDKIIETFITIIVVLSLQFLALFFHFFKGIGKIGASVVERMLENIGFVFVMVFLVLSRKELKQYFCCYKEKSIENKSDILEEFRESDDSSKLECEY